MGEAPRPDPLGDRMKDYERRETDRRFLPMLPVYARIDGRGFSRFTRGMRRPFDERMIVAMVSTTKHLVAETHARIGYTQSDEISLVWLAEAYGSEIFFAGRVQKMTSVLAAMATAAFTRAVLAAEPDFAAYAERLPHFDARAFQLPSRAEATNALLWREQDATKNAISMAASAYYSHKRLDGVSGAEKQELLFQAGVNFNDYPTAFKRGTFVRRAVFDRPLTAEELERIPEKHRPAPGQLVTRSEVRVLDMPPFGKVANREAVVFDGAEPAMEVGVDAAG